jgi:hypothetical protein
VPRFGSVRIRNGPNSFPQLLKGSSRHDRSPFPKSCSRRAKGCDGVGTVQGTCERPCLALAGWARAMARVRHFCHNPKKRQPPTGKIKWDYPQFQNAPLLWKRATNPTLGTERKQKTGVVCGSASEACIRFFLGGGRPRHASNSPAMSPDALRASAFWRGRARRLLKSKKMVSVPCGEAKISNGAGTQPGHSSSLYFISP